MSSKNKFLNTLIGGLFFGLFSVKHSMATLPTAPTALEVTLNYSGPDLGNWIVAVSTSPYFDESTIVLDSSAPRTSTTETSKTFVFTQGLIPNLTYYYIGLIQTIGALNPCDPKSFVFFPPDPSPSVYVAEGSTATVSLNLTKPTATGGISGNVISNLQISEIGISVIKGGLENSGPDVKWVGYFELPTTGFYSVSCLPDAPDYYIFAQGWNPDTQSYVEGQAGPIMVSGGGITSGVDIVLSTTPTGIKVQISTFNIYGLVMSTASVELTDAKVVLWDTLGGMEPVVILASTTLSLVPTSPCSQGANFKLSNQTLKLSSDINPYHYILEVSKDGYITQWLPLSFYQNSQAEFCVGTIELRKKASLSFVVTLSTPAIESGKPDAKVGVSVKIDGSANTLEDLQNIPWGAVKVVIDTNLDKKFSPFDWSLIWWESGKPYVKINPQTNQEDPKVFIDPTWDWTTKSKYLKEITYDELNIRQGQSDWSQDIWFGGFDIANAPAFIYEPFAIEWFGVNGAWQPVPPGDYPVKVLVDNPWDPNNGYDKEIFAGNVTVKSQGLKGTVAWFKDVNNNGIFDSGDSSGVVIGAEVTANQFYGWGRGITDNNGVFSISGLSPTPADADGYNIQVYHPNYGSGEIQNVKVIEGQVVEISTPIYIKKGIDVKINLSIQELKSATRSGEQLWVNLNGWPSVGYTGVSVSYSFPITLPTYSLSLYTSSFYLNVIPGTYDFELNIWGYTRDSKRNITIKEGSEISFLSKPPTILYSTTSVSIYGLVVDSNSVPISNAKVILWDTGGYWNWEPSIILSSTTTTSPTAGGPCALSISSYNFSFTNKQINVTDWNKGQYNYVLEVFAPGYQPYRRHLFYDQNSSLTTCEFVMLQPLPTLRFEVVLSTGAISPGKPDNDRVKIDVTIDASANTEEEVRRIPGGLVKVVVDTNRDTKFSPFQWELIWWEEGKPYIKGKYDTATGKFVEDAKIFINSTDPNRFDYLKEITMEELNARQSLSDWSWDYWFGGWDLASKSDKKISFQAEWFGVNSFWQAVAPGTYHIAVLADAPWSPENGIDNEIYKDKNNNPLVVTVKTQGIKGKVLWMKDENNDGVAESTGPVIGAEVSAEHYMGWGRGVSDESGVFFVSGLTPIPENEKGYRINVYHPDFGSASVEDIRVKEGEIVDIAAPIYLKKGLDVYVKLNIHNLRAAKWPADQLGAWIGAWPSWGYTGVPVHKTFPIALPKTALSLYTTSFTMNLVPGTYDIETSVWEYSRDTQRNVVINSTTTLEFNIYPESKITGWVVIDTSTLLPSFINVNISAHTDDWTKMAWGHTFVDLTRDTSAQFTIHNVSEGDYIIEFQPFAGRFEFEERTALNLAPTKIGPIKVLKSSDVYVGDVIISKGETLTGEITVSGLSAQLKMLTELLPPQEQANIGVILRITDENSRNSFGKYIEISTSALTTGWTTTYQVFNLPDSKYTIEAFLPGYQQHYVTNGSSTVGTPSGVSTNLPAPKIILAPFTGKVEGTVMKSEKDDRAIEIDMSKVIVGLSKPFEEEKIWERFEGEKDWVLREVLPHYIEMERHAIVFPDTSGKYVINNVKPDEYIIFCNEIKNKDMLFKEEEGPQPTGRFAWDYSPIKVIPDYTLTQDFELDIPAEIFGDVIISSPQAIARLYEIMKSTQYVTITLKGTRRVYSAEELKSKIRDMTRISAVPLDFWIKGERGGPDAPFIVDTTTFKVSYLIPSLPEGSYVVNTKPIDYDFDGTIDIAPYIETVYLNRGERKQVDVTFSKGYTIKGTVVRPKPNVQEKITIALLDKNGAEIKDYEIKYSTADTTTESQFEFSGIPAGKYRIKITAEVTVGEFTDSFAYPTIFREIEIKSDTTLTEKFVLGFGVSIVGQLYDSRGKAVNDGVSVKCYADPWIEGSYRIAGPAGEEDPETGEAFVLEISSGKFKLPSLPPGNYVLEVNPLPGFQFVPTMKSGIKVPVYSTTTYVVDIGSITLKIGGGIWGTVYLGGSTKTVAGIPVIAYPSGEKPTEENIYFAETDEDGDYAILGLDPDIRLWDMICNPRPHFLERKVIKYSEDYAQDVTTATITDFEIWDATGNIAGKITITDRKLKLPFPLGGVKDLPVALIIAQNPEDEADEDPLAGVWALTDSSGNFKISGLWQDDYKLLVVSKGIKPTYISSVTLPTNGNMNIDIGEVVITPGKAAGGVSGNITVRTSSGTFKLPAADFDTVFAITDIESEKPEFVFGSLTTDKVTNTIDQYFIEGLKANTTYNIVLSGNEGERILFIPKTFKLEYSTQSLTFNIEIDEELRAEANTLSFEYRQFGLGILPDAFEFLETGSLVDRRWFLILLKASDRIKVENNVEQYTITLTKGQGKIRFKSIGKDGSSIVFMYFAPVTETEFSFKLTATSVRDATFQQEYTIKVDEAVANKKKIDTLRGGKVTAEAGQVSGAEAGLSSAMQKLQKSDPSGIEVPAGAFVFVDTGTGRVNDIAMNSVIKKGCELSCKKVSTTTATTAPAISRMAPALSSSLSVSFAMPDLAVVPGKSVSAIYNFDANPAGLTMSFIKGQLAENKKAKVTIAYDTTSVKTSDMDYLDIYRYDETAKEWKVVKDGRSVDTKNGTISANTSSLSSFMAIVAAPEAPTTPTIVTTKTETVKQDGSVVLKIQGVVEITAEAGTFQAGDTLTANVLAAGTGGLPAKGDTSATPLGTAKQAGYFIEIKTASGAQPLKPLTVVCEYKDADITDENKLKIAQQRTDGQWIALESTVDTTNNKITAKVIHLSTFSVIELSPPTAPTHVIAYPNPYRPLKDTSLTISNIPANAKITIYTLTGSKVRELTADSSGVANWNGKNEDGDLVASGVYIGLIEGGGKKAIKIGVIK